MNYCSNPFEVFYFVFIDDARTLSLIKKKNFEGNERELIFQKKLLVEKLQSVLVLGTTAAAIGLAAAIFMQNCIVYSCSKIQ